MSEDEKREVELEVEVEVETENNKQTKLAWIKSFFSKLFKKFKKKEMSFDTIMIGPSTAGKTSLLVSLKACQYQKCYSFLNYDIYVSENEDNDDKDETFNYLNEQKDALLEGRLLGTRELKTLNLKFSVQKKNWIKFGLWLKLKKHLPFFFSKKIKDIMIMDAAGGHFFGEQKAKKAELEDHQLLWDKTIKDARNIIYCLPLPTTVIDQNLLKSNRFQKLQAKLLYKSKKIKNIFICITKIEKVFQEYGNNAFNQAMTREVMLTKLAEGFNKGYRTLLPHPEFLKQFNHTVEVFIYPVSAFGFIPENGGVNLNCEQDTLLTAYNKETYTLGEVEKYWAPFMTLDPLIHAVTGKKGKYVFSLEELTQKIDEL